MTAYKQENLISLSSGGWMSEAKALQRLVLSLLAVGGAS